MSLVMGVEKITFPCSDLIPFCHKCLVDFGKYVYLCCYNYKIVREIKMADSWWTLVP
jgi:hypothetical protein